MLGHWQHEPRIEHTHTQSKSGKRNLTMDLYTNLSEHKAISLEQSVECRVRYHYCQLDQARMKGSQGQATTKFRLLWDLRGSKGGHLRDNPNAGVGPTPPSRSHNSARVPSLMVYNGNTTFQNGNLLKQRLIGFANIRCLIALGTSHACPLWNRSLHCCDKFTMKFSLES